MTTELNLRASGAYISKFTLDEDANEIYVPDYQREFVWDEKKQSRFIESIMIGLPIPLVFLSQNDNKDFRFEIVDGSQRIRTLANFMSSDLTMQGLEKLDKMNGLKYSDLTPARKRHFKNVPLRVVVLTEKSTDETRNEIFERLNNGGEQLKDMEKRKGFYKGLFNDYIYEKCAINSVLVNNAPMSRFLIKRQELEELSLRFFMLYDQYPNYKRDIGISRQLDEYMLLMNKEFDSNPELVQRYDELFNSMLKFVDENCISGFRKNNITPQVSRVYFEAVSVGVALALKERPNLQVSRETFSNFLMSKEFRECISGKYHTHTPKRLNERINMVRDFLLGE